MWYNAPKLFQATGRQQFGCIISYAVQHSLALLRMGKKLPKLCWADWNINKFLLLYLVGLLHYLDIFSSCCSPYIFGMVKTRTVWLVGHVASMGLKINNRNYSYSGWELWSNEATLWYGWDDNIEIDVMKYVWLLWAGFIRFRLGRGGGVFWARRFIFGFCEQAWKFLAS